jgi:hypothetical protein
MVDFARRLGVRGGIDAVACTLSTHMQRRFHLMNPLSCPLPFNFFTLFHPFALRRVA